MSIVELDEMQTYVGNKKNIVGYGLLLMEMKNGPSTALLVAGGRKQDKSSGKS